MPVEKRPLRPPSLHAQAGAVHIISFAGATAPVRARLNNGSLFGENQGSRFPDH